VYSYDRSPIWEPGFANFLIKIDHKQLLTEWAVIAFGTGAAVVALGLFKRKEDSPASDSVDEQAGGNDGS